jgi:hypothetical protein
MEIGGLLVTVVLLALVLATVAGFAAAGPSHDDGGAHER